MEDWIRELIAERDRVQGKTKPVTETNNTAPTITTTTGNTASQAQAQTKPKVTVDDFDLLTVIGKGSFGKVIQVRKKDNGKIYAMKVLNKKTIYERGEVEHTKSERKILQKLCHPFLVNLNYSFQTPDKLYFIMDYINGGELFFHLQKDKKFSEDRARFYCAEIVLGLEYLHNSGVLYRDLKPENLLLTSDGHICMTDFGISKDNLQNEDQTTTFCGTPEYLAPEVLEGNGYGKAVDWWSFGTLMYEMLTGLPPFYSEDIQMMYQQILGGQLNITNVSDTAKDLIERLLVRDPNNRLVDPKVIKQHPWFSSIDWAKLETKEVTPPFIPPVKDELDTTQIAEEFTEEAPVLSPPNKDSGMSDHPNFDEFTYVAPSAL